MGGTFVSQILCLHVQSNKLSAQTALPVIEFNKSLLRSSYFNATVNLLKNTGKSGARIQQFFRKASVSSPSA